MREEEKNVAMIPIGILEMHEDRFAEEKRRIRNHYRNIIIWICIVFLVYIFLTFGAASYVLYNYEFASYSQDGNGINNILGRQAQQGDINYGAKTEDNKAQTPSAKGNSNQ